MNKYRKDSKPENTIENIKNILKKLDIEVVENTETTFENYLYYTRLTIEGLYDIGVNGKGSTEMYSRASAYSELMERLFGGILIQNKFRCYKIINSSKGFTTADLKRNEIRQCIDTYFGRYVEGNGIEDFVTYIVNNNNELLFQPYYNIQERRSELLPESLIKFFNGSNGLCAGNSPEEAITQGLCEIFERYIRKEIYFNSYNSTSISEEYYKNSYCNEIIQKLKNENYIVDVRDCTYNGQYPVLGVVVVDPSREYCFLSIGSDPDFDICLERCLTELFQGRTFKNFATKLFKIFTYDSIELELAIKNNDYDVINVYFNKFIKDGTAPIPNSFWGVKEFDSRNLNVFKSFNNSKDALNYCIGLTKNFNIFINKYLSYNDIFVYRVFVKDMSTISYWSNNRIELLKTEKKFIKGYFKLINNTLDSNEMEFILDELNKRTYYYGGNPLLVIFDLPNCFQRINTLNSDYVIYKLLLKLHKYDECIQLLKNRNNSISNKLLYSQLMGLEFMKNGIFDKFKEKIDIFCPKFKKMYSNLYDVNFEVSEEWIGDQCDSCKIRDCKKEKIEKIMQNISLLREGEQK